MSEYVSLATLLEDPIQEIKNELQSLGIFDDINEGEQVYTGEGAWAMVIPWIDQIEHRGNQQLLHHQTVYVTFLQGAENSSLRDLSQKATLGYDKLMLDQRHNNTCWNCLPTHWAGGFYSLGDYSFVGIQTAWEIRNFQTFALPDALGDGYTTMRGITETPLEAIKTRLRAMAELDDVSEGEKTYPGQGTVAWVISGPDQIDTLNFRTLQHQQTIYSDLISSKDMTLAEMRMIGEKVYDAMMEDPTLDGTCTVCLPRQWHPGFLQYGEQSYVGIESIWGARVLQQYTPT